MRTRFLNIDYFNSASETLDFLHLPVPHLPPSSLSNFNDLRCFDDASFLTVSLEIERFPIENALSKFFSDVLPNLIDVDIGDFSNDEQRHLSSQNGVEIQTSEMENNTSVEGKGENNMVVTQFETPELDLFVENAYFSGREGTRIFSEVDEEADNILDILNPELTVQYLSGVQESVYLVDDITPKCCIEESVMEGDGSLVDQFHPYHSTFPLLEVDEIGLGIFTSKFIEDGFILLLENVEPKEWTQKGEVAGDAKEFLGSRNIDLLEYISDHFLSKQCLESEMACSNEFLEMDILGVIELSHVGGISIFHPGTPDDLFSVSLFLFEDFHFLDLYTSQIFEVFPNLQTLNEPEICEQMFREDIKIRKFDELITSPELTLLDDSFKSLPVPILSDHERTRSLCAFLEEMLAKLKPESLSASDGIYLDWHLLEDDRCNYNIHTSQILLDEIDMYSTDSDLESFDHGLLVLDLVFAGDTLNGPITEESKEMLNMSTGSISVVHGLPKGMTLGELPDDICQKPGNGEGVTDMNTEKVHSLVGSMSQFNDLDFFLNPRQAISGKNHELSDNAFKATFPVVSISDSIAACSATIRQLQVWDIKLHPVKLSDGILALIDSFQQCYIAILKKDIELTKRGCSFEAADNLQLLSLPKEKLMDCIMKTSAKRTTLVRDDNNIQALFTLRAIKYIAWYLCYYGIHTTLLYVDKLCQRSESLKHKLSFLQILIKDEDGKANGDITKSHPSLTSIKEILQSNIKQSSLKVLIVADQVFWYPLKRLLTSMNISFNELQNFNMHTSQHVAGTEFTDVTMDSILQSVCSFISHEHVSASFPFDKFGIILEYGGSCGSSRVSTISPNLVGVPRLHFVKVELEDYSVPKALCEGVYFPQGSGFTMKGDPYSYVPSPFNESIQNLEELLNFVPGGEYNMGPLKAADNIEACCTTLPIPRVQLATESEQLRAMHSFPDAVIIVNTQPFEKEMIISRRSTYQRILAIEKEGAQIVERDLDLPVDVIISAAVCLAWYDCSSIGKKATATDEASSCLPFYIENIAANVLTSLSFTFSGCILVFEGESSLLAAVMESSDELYAAAASLGIDLQLFCSYSSELTDDIILSCIGRATKLTRGICPKMSESETLAEYFLSTFPSINPLSAHAILSSGGMLVEFLEWSYEQRIHALQKYHVPDESVALFSALCKYGEREDSKSGTTDCSSVSSAPDSDNCHRKNGSGRKRQKYVESTYKIDIPMNDIFHFEPLKEFTDGSLDCPRMSKPYDSWLSKGSGILDKIENSSLSFDDKLFGNKHGSGIAPLLNSSGVRNPYDSQMSRGLDMSDDIKNTSLPLKDKLFGPEQELDMPLTNKVGQCFKSNSANLQDFMGEIIDIDGSSSLGEDFSFANSIYFTTSVLEMEKEPAAGNSRTARKSLFGRSCLPPFPTSSGINSDSSEAWTSVKDHGQILTEGINRHSDEDLPLKDQKKVVDKSEQKAATNFRRQSFQERGTPNYGGTPLSNAIRSAQSQQGSPWTIEFLNRIREKSRLRQQSLPCDMSPCVGYSGNTLKVTKRKSPSILDFYKYQGGNNPNKNFEPKRQKRSVQPSSSSMNKKTSDSLLPTWTPIDKRARRMLSFATNGGKGQSKLVWSDKNAQTLYRRF